MDRNGVTRKPLGAEHEGARTLLREAIGELAQDIRKDAADFIEHQDYAEYKLLTCYAERLEAMAEGPGEAERLREALQNLVADAPDSCGNESCDCAHYKASLAKARYVLAGAQVPPATPAPVQPTEICWFLDCKETRIPFSHYCQRHSLEPAATPQYPFTPEIEKRLDEREKGAFVEVDLQPAASQPADEFTPPAYFKRGREFEIKLFEQHAREHHPLIPGLCSWCRITIESQPAAAPQPQEACPHCGVPLTGMNSNPDECLHKPQEELMPDEREARIRYNNAHVIQPDAQIAFLLERLDAVRKETIERCAPLRELANWLDNEAEERMKDAMSRRDYADGMKDASPEDLRAAHKIAEQMMGRKIKATTTMGAKIHAEINEKIAVKLESESRMLSRWSDRLRALATARTEGKP